MRKKLLKNMDWGVLVCTVLLFIVGLFALFSTTQNTNHIEFIKQLKWFAISIPFFVLAVIIDYDKILKIAPAAYGISIFLLILVIFTKPISGASSWFTIGGVSFQPSEIGKIATILFMAYTLNLLQAKGRKEINKIYKLGIILAVAALPILLVLKEPDLGTSIAYIFATLFIIFTSGINKRYIFAAIILVVIIAPVVYMHLPAHALARIDVFLHPEKDPRGAGYNIMQSKLAIGAGQIFGIGYLQGNQTQLGYLHPKTTDFIFSAIGEEMGFVTAAAIVILYVVLITRIVFVAKTAKDNVGSCIAIGIAGILCFHMLQNIGMTIGILPITGVPLPFVSYGGSALLANFIAIGLVLNVSARRQKAIFIE